MNKKLITAIFLISGTAIGAGLLALPLVLAKVGVIPLVLILMGTWGFMYFISLLGIELAIRKTKPFSLGLLGVLSFIILFYALLAAYLDGSASIIQNISLSLFHFPLSLQTAQITIFCLLVLTLSCMFSLIERINAILFVLLLVIVGFLVVAIGLRTPLIPIPLIEAPANDLKTWAIIVPLVFTSFGFNAVVEPITVLLDRNPSLIKKAFFWGSLIPLGVYLFWTLGILYVIYGARLDIYEQMVHGHMDLGLLIQVLSELSGHWFVQALIWGISLLAIFTSALGIGVSLIYLFETYCLTGLSLSQRTSRSFTSYLGHLFRVVCLGAPVLFITLFILDAFIKILAFAGMILVINAVLLPLYEAFITHKGHLESFPSLKHKWLLWGALFVALGIMGSEIYNLCG